MRRAFPIIVFVFAAVFFLQAEDLFAWGDCTVQIQGPTAVALGESVVLSATGSPEGGTCGWSSTPGLGGSGCSATFTGQENGVFWATVTYSKGPSDFKCYDVARIKVGGGCKDNDGDGHKGATADCPEGDDCDDGDSTVYPGALEVCDGTDNNCDGEADEGLSADADGDGHYTADSCDTPNDDCDDGDATVYPGAPEVSDGKDNDCDGDSDESETPPDTDIGPNPQEGDGPPQGQENAGEPINIATGNAYMHQTDFRTAGRGLHPRLSLTFERTYNSRTSYAGPFGHGWTHNFNVSVIPGNPVGVRRESGQVLYFTLQDDGTYAPSKGVHNTLAKTGDQYLFTTVDHIVYTFASDGKLTQISDLHGNKVILFYESEKLASITDDFGGSIAFEYSGERITKVTDPAGEEYTYAYDDNTSPNLVSVSYPSGGESVGRGYLYEDTRDPHNLTGVIDENEGRWLSYGYDAEDRATLSESAGGVTRIEVDYSGGDTIIVKNSLAKKSIFTRQTKDSMFYISRIEEASEEGGRCSTCGPYGSFLYGEGHTLDAVVDAMEHESTYTYDERGNLLTETEAKGTEVERTVSYTYHAVFNKPTVIKTASVDIPGEERATDLSYNGVGDPVLVTRKGYVGGTLHSRSTALEYNERGQLTKLDGPRTDVSDTIELTYHPNEISYGNKRGMLHKITTAAGTTQYLDYDACGHPLRLLDPNGVEIVYTYSPRGWMESKTTGGRTYAYGHDRVGQLIQAKDPEGRIMIFRYDGAHRLYEIENSTGERIHYTLDTEGNRIGEEIFDAGGSSAKSVSREYDNRNMLWCERYPDESSRCYSYDLLGNRVSVTDENDHTAGYAYDALNRLRKTTEVLGEESVLTEQAYDVHDNVVSVTDAERHVTSYDFDDFGEVLTISSPDTGVTTFGYDEAGNVVSRKDARDIAVGYVYDSLNRLLKVDYPADPDMSYTFDTGENGRGRLTGMSDGAGSYKFGYDALGNLTREERTLGGRVYVTEYRYDGAGLLTGLTYPSGKRLDYELDGTGRISRATGGPRPSRDLAGAVTYRPFGPLASLTLGNGIALTRSFDTRYQLTAQKAGSILSLTYSRDAAGKILSIADALDPGRSQSFAYDDLSRLTSARGIYNAIGYTYDRVGNRMTETVGGATNAYQYSEGTNRLNAISGLGSTSFGYDANGNTTSAGTMSLNYGQNNRLIKASQRGRVVGEYGYNGFGQRITKTGVHYHYDLKGRLIAETNARSGKTIWEYYYADDMLLAVTDGDTLYYVHTDHRGSPVRMTDPKGTPVWLADYRPFGQADVRSTSRRPAKAVMNLRFPGQYFDVETGNHYNWHRDYSPRTGRYLTPDPIGLAGGINPYAYVQNDPLNLVDPLGLLTAVIIGNPTKGNPFGHAAIATTENGVVSFGTGTALNSSLTNYILAQAAYRDSTVYIINSTTEQERAIRGYLSQFKDNKIPRVPGVDSGDTCASRTNGALSQGGFSDPSIDPTSYYSPFPNDTESLAKSITESTNGIVISIPKGTTTIPSALNVFNPR